MLVHMKSPTVAQLAALLEEQRTEITALRAAIDVQFHRMAAMQAKLDVTPQARERRKLIRARLPQHHNGNEHRPGLIAEIGQSNRIQGAEDRAVVKRRK